MTKRMIVAPESKTQKLTEIADDQQPPPRVETASFRRALERFDSPKQFIYPLERITRGSIVIRNVKFPGADEAYPQPQQARYRFVTSFYPYADGGPLYVDEPKNEQEVHRAYERQKVMKKLKHRYVIIEKDTNYEHLLEQLGLL